MKLYILNLYLRTKTDDGYAIKKAFPGYELIQTLFAQDKKTVYLYERLASKEVHQEYLKFRTEGGLMGFLGPRLEGEYQFDYCNDVD